MARVSRWLARSSPWRDPTVLGLALLLSLMNALKPLVVDDAEYFYYARHIAEHPSDPFGFEVLAQDDYEPAHHGLVPAVLPYWWAAAVALFGDRPFLWKLWLFPFAWALAGSLLVLLRRFAPGLERPLLSMTVLSPTLLPHFNLMLDVPALALGLLAVALFLRACDRASAPGALIAGLVGALAMQTKYSAAISLGVALAWAVVSRRLRLGLLAAGAAAGLFAGWESWLAARYGESQFLHSLGWVGEWTGTSGDRALGLVAILGAVAPPVALVAGVALGARRGALLAAGLLAALAFAAIPALPPRPLARTSGWPVFDASSPELLLLFPLGLAIAAALLAALLRLPRRADPERAGTGSFLLAWVGIELIGFFALTPFLAVRRVMGLVVASTVAAGCAAARRSDAAGSVRAVAAFGVALGVLFWLSDLSDARTRVQAVARIAPEVERLGGDLTRETIWAVGQWDYRFYTERLGMRQLVAGRSALAPGDWVIGVRGVVGQRLPRISGLSPPLGGFAARNAWPWSTLPSAYGGAIPIRRQPEAQIQIEIRRVLEGSRLAPLPARPRASLPPRAAPDRRTRQPPQRWSAGLGLVHEPSRPLASKTTRAPNTPGYSQRSRP